jgi:hypothetical protein
MRLKEIYACPAQERNIWLTLSDYSRLQLLSNLNSQIINLV